MILQSAAAVAGAALLLFISVIPAKAQDGPPLFVETSCEAQTADPALLPRLRCGTVAVPRLGGDPGSGTYRIAVRVVLGEQSGTERLAVVALAGGPGMKAGPPVLEAFVLGLVPGYDLVLIDQRGSGDSEPFICRDAEIFTGPARDDVQTVRSLLDLAQAAGRACLAEAEEAGALPEEFGAAVNADDVEAVRRALGYGPWAAVGTSYGAVTGLELASRHPQSLSALVLDSPALGGREFGTVRDSSRRAWLGLLTECASDPACHREFPDLQGELDNALAALSAEPLAVPVPAALGAPGNVVMFDATDLQSLLFFPAYDRQGIGILPYIVRAAAHREGDLLAFMMLGSLRAGSLSLFGLVANQCRDGAAANWADLQQGEDPVGAFEVIMTRPETCGHWLGTVPAPAMPEASGVPMIVMSGALDPITPPANARWLAQALGGVRLFEFAAVGHAVPFQSPCGMQVMRQFIANPRAEIAVPCMASHPPIRFGPAPEAVMRAALDGSAGEATGVEP